MITLTGWGIFWTVIGMLLAPRLTLGIFLIILGYTGLGIVAIIWAIIEGFKS